MIKRGEDDAPLDRNLEFDEAVFLELEISRHAAVDVRAILVLDPDTTAKGHALQVALEVVIPLVVGAGKIRRVAVLLLAKDHAAVRAAVLNDVDRAIGIAHDDDRTLTDPGTLEITGVGNLTLQANINPVAVIKETL